MRQFVVVASMRVKGSVFGVRRLVTALGFNTAWNRGIPSFSNRFETQSGDRSPHSENYRKNRNVTTTNSGIKIPQLYAMYPKKLGIFTPFSSAIALTIKFGPFPIYVFAPMNTAPQEIAASSRSA